MSTEVESVRAMKLCYKFDECNAPKCPLDPRRLHRTKRQPGEPECKLSHHLRRKYRRQFAATYSQ